MCIRDREYAEVQREILKIKNNVSELLKTHPNSSKRVQEVIENYKGQTQLNPIVGEEIFLKKIDGIKVVGTAKDKVGIFSFTTDKVHYYDLGLLLDAKGIALRTGHHCTQPLMDKYSLDGTARLSLAIYNSTEEVDYFVESLSNLIKR